MKKYLEGPETERLRHRAMTVDDAEAFFALNSLPAVMRYTGETPVASVEEARAAIAAYPDFETVGFGRWACVSKATGEVIGFCGLKYLDELDAVDVGYRFLPECWGRGLATEACAATLDFAFETIGLEEVIALVLPDNAASVRVLEKVGMEPAGQVEFDGLTALRYRVRRP